MIKLKSKEEESLQARTSREFRCITSILLCIIEIVKGQKILIKDIRISQLLHASWREEVRRSHFYLNI